MRVLLLPLLCLLSPPAFLACTTCFDQTTPAVAAAPGGLSTLVLPSGVTSASAGSTVQENLDAGVGFLTLAVGDFNGDGNADVALSGSNATLQILLGDGTGAFTEAAPVGLAGELLQLVAADINQDGKVDLLALTLAGDVEAFLGNGDGTFQPPHAAGLPADGFDTGEIVWTALPGDGGPAVGALGTAEETEDVSVAALVLLPTSAASSLGTNPVYLPLSEAFSTDGSLEVASGSFARAGERDLLVWDPEGAQFELLFGRDGGPDAGALTACGLATLPSGASAGFAIADFNADGLSDVAFPNGSSQVVSVFLGIGDGGFQLTSASPDLFPNDSTPSPILAAGDFNGDGKADVAAFDTTAGGLVILLGKGDGTFQSPISVGTATGQQVSAAFLHGQDGGAAVLILDKGANASPARTICSAAEDEN